MKSLATDVNAYIAGFPPAVQAVLNAGPKGNLQFPLDQPIPYALITRIVKARLRENRPAASGKAKGKKSKTIRS
jgi:uncharacterized protein YdhG (YjbR/CyaY superfamily)